MLSGRNKQWPIPAIVIFSIHRDGDLSSNKCSVVGRNHSAQFCLNVFSNVWFIKQNTFH